jgi:hypothetical protein
MVVRSDPVAPAATAERGELPVRVLAKVGEASLKGRNKRFFLDTLRRNLKAALQGVDARLEDGGSVTAIAVPDEGVAEEVGARLERVFGFALPPVWPASGTPRRSRRPLCA